MHAHPQAVNHSPQSLSLSIFRIDGQMAGQESAQKRISHLLVPRRRRRSRVACAWRFLVGTVVSVVVSRGGSRDKSLRKSRLVRNLWRRRGSQPCASPTTIGANCSDEAHQSCSFHVRRAVTCWEHLLQNIGLRPPLRQAAAFATGIVAVAAGLRAA